MFIKFKLILIIVLLSLYQHVIINKKQEIQILSLIYNIIILPLY